MGNQAVSRLLTGNRMPPVQTKLSVGPTNDKYEQEADRMAKQVANTIDSSGQPTVQRQSLPEEQELVQSKLADIQRQVESEEEEFAQTQRQTNANSRTVSPVVQSAVQRSNGSGQPLNENLRGSMERAFRADFSDVKVHTDSLSDALNRSLNARALTIGQNLFFRSGEYNTATSSGRELIAHELTHVLQQNGAALRQKPAVGVTGQLREAMAEPRIQRQDEPSEEELEKCNLCKELRIIKGNTVVNNRDIRKENRRTRQVLRRLLGVKRK
jgi:hypothetical protein